MNKIKNICKYIYNQNTALKIAVLIVGMFINVSPLLGAPSWEQEYLDLRVSQLESQNNSLRSAAEDSGATNDQVIVSLLQSIESEISSLRSAIGIYPSATYTQVQTCASRLNAITRHLKDFRDEVSNYFANVQFKLDNIDNNVATIAENIVDINSYIGDIDGVINLMYSNIESIDNALQDMLYYVSNMDSVLYSQSVSVDAILSNMTNPDSYFNLFLSDLLSNLLNRLSDSLSVTGKVEIVSGGGDGGSDDNTISVRVENFPTSLGARPIMVTLSGPTNSVQIDSSVDNPVYVTSVDTNGVQNITLLIQALSDLLSSNNFNATISNFPEIEIPTNHTVFVSNMPEMPTNIEAVLRWNLHFEDAISYTAWALNPIGARVSGEWQNSYLSASPSHADIDGSSLETAITSLGMAQLKIQSHINDGVARMVMLMAQGSQAANETKDFVTGKLSEIDSSIDEFEEKLRSVLFPDDKEENMIAVRDAARKPLDEWEFGSFQRPVDVRFRLNSFSIWGFEFDTVEISSDISPALAFIDFMRDFCIAVYTMLFLALSIFIIYYICRGAIWCINFVSGALNS